MLSLPFDTGPDRKSRLQDLVTAAYAILEERGTLTKTEIDVLFAPTEDEYALLQRGLLAKPGVARRPGGRGFVLSDARPAAIEGGHDTGEPSLSVPERRAVDLLIELLNAKALAELVGDELRGVLRSIRRIQSGRRVDRPLRQRELAVALVVKEGLELLADGSVRESIGREVNRRRVKQGLKRIDVPQRWHPGKQGAIEFTNAAGFPREFAGTPAGERPKDYEFLQGRIELPSLEPFQIEVKDRMIDTLSEPLGRAILSLPTGAGKTRSAVEALREWLTRRHHSGRHSSQNVALWLAHTEELCEQAYASFRQAWEGSSNACPLYLIRFWGSYTADLVHHSGTLKSALASTSVFISTPQRFANLFHEATEEAEYAVAGLRNAVSALVIDEAHRAAAPTYQQILSLFDGLGDASVIGLTATPFRKEYAPDRLEGTFLLAGLFSKKILQPDVTLGADARQRLQDMGILAKPILETIRTNIRLTLPPGVDGHRDLTPDDIERADFALRIKADASAARRLTLTEKIVAICAERSTNSVLYFGPSVADAATVAFLVRERGHRAAFVSGNTPEPVRRQIIDQFRRGDVRVLCNCEVLTTGFDAPRVTHIVVGRPTLSQVLYEQMVGRGLRGPKFGGTEHCVIVNCVDDYTRETPVFGWVGWRDAWKPQVQGEELLA